MFALAVAAVGLAALTYRFVEAPAAALFRRRPFALALGLVAALAATGVVGRVTYDSKGFPGRFPPLVTQVFDFSVNGAEGQRLMDCFYQRDDRAYPLEEERRRAARFFADHRCGVAEDPAKPTILVVGDSHAAHLFAGLTRTFGDRANIMALAAVFCVPLVENVAMDQGVAGTPRCRAINDYVFRRIREIKPDVLVVGGYFAQYDHEANWRYPGFLDAMVAGARKLARGRRPLDRRSRARSRPGRRSCRSWSGATFWKRASRRNFRGSASDRTRSKPTGRLPPKDWGPGVTYVSQADKLCGPDGCRRLVGPDLPDDLLAVDYGHYSRQGLDLRGRRRSSRRRSRRRSTKRAGCDSRWPGQPTAADCCNARKRSTGSARGRRRAARTSESIGDSSA